jgi:hypothetical protein
MNDIAAAPTIEAVQSRPAINWHNLWWVATALIVMVVAIRSEDLFLLNFAHVATGVLWTGIDLFMGFIVGPINRRMDFSARRQFTTRLMPKMLFLMPALSTITPTTGWYLAELRGFTALPYPEYGWMLAALIITTILGIQGVLVLLPTNVRVAFEIAKPNPDMEKVVRLMRRYVRIVAFQGSMQLAILVIMAKFATGL